MIIDAFTLKAVTRNRSGKRPHNQAKRLFRQIAKQLSIERVSHDLPVVDNRNIAAERSRLPQDNGWSRIMVVPAALISLQKIVHRPPHLNIHTRGRLIKNQKLGCMNQRSRDHEATLHTARKHSALTLSLLRKPKRFR